MGVGLSEDGKMLRWWSVRPGHPSQKTEETGEREQTVEDFRSHGPSRDNVTEWELDNPDWINHMYDPLYDGGEPGVINGPRRHEIPDAVLEELAKCVGADPKLWPPPPDTTIGGEVQPTESPGTAATTPSEPANHASDPMVSRVAASLPTSRTQERAEAPVVLQQLLEKVPVGIRHWKTGKKGKKVVWTPPYRPVPPVAGEQDHLNRLFRANGGLARSVRGAIFHLHHFGSLVENRLMELFGSTLAGVLFSANDLRDLIAVIADARQAARQCGTQGMPVESDVIWRFAAAKVDFSDLVREMFQRASALGKRLIRLSRLGMRLLCMEDDFFRALVSEYAAGLEQLVQTDLDAEKLVGLLAKTTQRSGVHAEALLQVLPKTKKALGMKTNLEVFAFYETLIKRGTYLFGMNEPSWLAEMRQKRENPNGSRNSDKVLAALNEHQELYEFAKPWLTSPRAGNQIVKAVEQMYRHHFGYSDLQADMEGQIPVVMKICHSLVTSLEEFVSLCTAIPRLIEQLPRDGESTPLGWTHDFSVSDLEHRVRYCQTLEQLLSDVPTSELERMNKSSQSVRTKVGKKKARA